MKITEINFQTFLSKQKYLSKTGFENMQKLLIKMNEQAVYTNPTPSTYESNVLDRIYIGNRGYFMDCRWLPKKNYLPTELVKGSSCVAMHKTQVRIHNLDGKAEILEKPWYRSAMGIMKKTEEFIRTGLREFDNENVVERRFHEIRGFTKEGLKNL